jgi:hypothetical protein
MAKFFAATVAAFSLSTCIFGAPASAQALSDAEIACRDAIATSTAKYTKVVQSVIQKCHALRSSGGRSIGDDCNLASSADSLGKLPKARTKVAEKILAACTGQDALLSAYPACPAPASTVDDGGATTGIDHFGELSACETALVDAGIGETASDGMGSPDDRMLGALVDCQKAVGKGAAGVVRAHQSQKRKCQKAADQTSGEPSFTCDAYDDDGKIAKARGKLHDLVFKACDFIPEAELAKMNACADTAAMLADCAQASADTHGADLIHSAYELPDPSTTTTTTTSSTSTTTTTTTTTTIGTACGSTFPTCNGDCSPGSTCQSSGAACECVATAGSCEPATILRHLNARYGTPAGATFLSTGWTGATHVVDVPDDSFDAIDVTCDADCQNCQVDLNRRAGDLTSNCRCAGSPQQTCNAVGGADVESCGSFNPTCNCYFGPGLAISSGGTPVCVLNVVREDYSGTMNLREGNYGDVIKLASLVHLGISQFAPCPTCEDDTTPGDGVRDGSCNGGLQNGQSCDVNGIHRTFGATSFDCPPASTSNISGGGLQITLNLKTGEQQLEAALPCEAGGGLCPCKVCSGNSQLGCTSDADCAAESAGTCTAGGDVNIERNACDDGICTAAGVCATGPIDTYCDGAVHADGRGFVSCTTDIDCGALDAGSCTVQDIRRCFPDPIVVTGVQDVYNPVTGAIFCIPPTTSLPVNQTAGLPGPGATNLEFDADVRCQSDTTLEYQFPDGANCPQLTTTTTTTTTTVTLPVPACGSATFPTCGGTCPGAQACTPTVVNTCACVGL